MRAIRMATCATAAFIMLLMSGAAHGQEPPHRATAGPDKLFFPPCPGFRQNLSFDCYHSYAEVTSFLRAAVAAYPQYARLESMGSSYEGRDLWVITITDLGTGDASHKPAIWVDGGIDADEVVATEAALGLVHRLLTSDDERIAELRRTRTFYIAPSVIPDVSELHHTTHIRPRDTTMRPWDDDGDGLLDEDGPEDLDGDGHSLQMRVPDPDGAWVKDERDERLMRRRRMDDDGPFYQVHPESLDRDDDGRYGEDPVGGVDPNRNYPGNWSLEQGGAGPFPGSEHELRAMLDFALAHPNIAASQHLHSSGGVILRPPSVPDLQLPPEDEQLYIAMSRAGLEVTGYNLATSVYDWNWPRGSRNTRPGQVWRDSAGELQGAGESSYPAFGGSIDAMYLLFGALAFANEIYQMGEDLDGNGTVEAIEQLAYNDDVLDGGAFREWTAFDHPQLGAVEIGGWRKFGHNNPLPVDLPREVERNADFILLQAVHTQLLEIADTEVESLGGGVYRVRARVRNAGFVPTELAIRSQQGTAVPVRVTLDGAAGVELLSAKSRQELGILAGYTAERVEWLVRAPDGGTATVTATHPKAGTVSAQVQVGR